VGGVEGGFVGGFYACEGCQFPQIYIVTCMSFRRGTKDNPSRTL
jgi:hypothetical protein